jgi:hypothetical protein
MPPTHTHTHCTHCFACAYAFADSFFFVCVLGVLSRCWLWLCRPTVGTSRVADSTIICTFGTATHTKSFTRMCVLRALCMHSIVCSLFSHLFFGVCRFKGHKNTISSLCFRRGSHQLFSGSFDRQGMWCPPPPLRPHHMHAMQRRSEESCRMMNDLRTPMNGLNKPLILKQIIPLMQLLSLCCSAASPTHTHVSAVWI